MSEAGSSETKNGTIQEIKYVPSTENSKIQELKPENDVKKPDTLFLYFTVLTALLVVFAGTTSVVWASPALVKLKSNDTHVNPLGRPITTMEISTLLGLPLFLSIFVNFFLPKVADLIGRKKTLQAIGFGIFASTVGLAFSSRVELMILCVSISVCLYCAGFALIPVYLTEICEDHNRAKFGCFISVFIPLGNLYTFIVGPAFNLRNFTLITTAPLTFFLIFFFITPESPVYLLTKGKRKECMTALKKLRSNKTDKELEIDLNRINKSILDNKQQTGYNVFTIFQTKESRIGIMLSIMLLLVRLLSGVLIVTSLLAPIFNEAGTHLSGNTVAIITGILSVVSAIFPCFVVEKFGKKLLLLTSTLGAGLSISVLGIYFFLKHIHSPITHQVQWLPVVCIAFYIISYFAGLGPIPVAMAGELFLSNIRSLAVSSALTVSVTFYCLLSFGYPLLAEAFGTHWCLWGFGFCCFLGSVLIYILLPDTTGKTILEIQEILKNY